MEEMTRKHSVSRSTAIIIGTSIREARERRHWTSYRLAERAEVSYNSVVSWEDGRVVPELGTLLHLADILGLCSVDELLGGSTGLSHIRSAVGSALRDHVSSDDGP